MTNKFLQFGIPAYLAMGTRKRLSFLLKGGFAAVFAIGLSSCAGSPAPKLSLTETGSLAAKAENKDVDCGKITGRMQIRILQIRDYNQSTKTSGVSQTLQGMVKNIFGGTSRGLDPDGEHANDIEQLRQQNAQLAAKGCKTFDLEAELQPKNFKQTPTPR